MIDTPYIDGVDDEYTMKVLLELQRILKEDFNSNSLDRVEVLFNNTKFKKEYSFDKSSPEYKGIIDIAWSNHDLSYNGMRQAIMGSDYIKTVSEKIRLYIDMQLEKFIYEEMVGRVNRAQIVIIDSTFKRMINERLVISFDEVIPKIIKMMRNDLDKYSFGNLDINRQNGLTYVFSNINESANYPFIVNEIDFRANMFEVLANRNKRKKWRTRKLFLSSGIDLILKELEKYNVQCVYVPKGDFFLLKEPLGKTMANIDVNFDKEEVFSNNDFSKKSGFMRFGKIGKGLN